MITVPASNISFIANPVIKWLDGIQPGNVDEALNQLASMITTPDTTAFGEQSIAELTPIVQVDFPYNINTQLMETRLNNGAASIATQRLKISTGAFANQSVIALTRTPVKYNPGQGGLVRFTSIYTTGVANSTQIHGVGSESDGYFFGYNGEAFGVLRRSSGSVKIVQLIVTTKASSAGNVTVTLDGDATLVAVTDATATDATTTANEIAAGDYSNAGTGWRASAHGAIVTFISYDAAIHGGSYSFIGGLSGAVAAAGITNVVTGVAPTDTWTAQTSWSEDVMDGTGPSGMTLDPTKGNVYQIRYQWLGFGMITFSIEDSTTGKIVPVHKIQYANANTITSVQNPTLPIWMAVKNTSNDSDIVMFSGSMAGFIEGKKGSSGVRHGTDTTSGSFTVDVETPVITIRNKQVYQGKENRVDILLSFAGLSQDSTKTATVRATVNGTLTGASFSDVSTNTSPIEVDISASAISGGEIEGSQGISKAGGTQFDPKGDLLLKPGETFTLSIIPNAGNPDVTAAVTWIDDF